ncbi:hypothetical protein EB795_17515 [Pseudomonas mandelii]|nr:hypothetical protein [Pseudomonas mandelii]
MYTHLIHRPVHSFRGQVEKLQAAIHKALRVDYKVFSLTLGYQLCSPWHFARCDGQTDDGAKPVTTALSRVFPEFNHRLIHRLAHCISSHFAIQQKG